ncbi:NAD(P)H-dependent flavin oxidoreductase [Aspergillus aculeatinus CBS 121060]|uniref:Inosine monophosphate dehydrogenase n=1 Tax=Aspergillus aculeatinus CBS 121060 TaxID=1448322 RepID=A0ACD1HCQ8_9EURO|nr:inosine monophosphate dehydrogenase [Aspergillus aculeatinus CBS 121060]RAH71267.1 inosine monophosphate dehydrogenase [Aspergillus aculeatinus CBS 121060]
MSTAKLAQAFPWLQSPIIINAPMSGFATDSLATAVTRAGGLGYIGFLPSLPELETHLQHARQSLPLSPDTDILPIGLGIIVAVTSPSAVTALVAEYKPAVVWLSFGAPADFAAWTAMIRTASPQTHVWIQIGSVTAAVEAARACRPDALVIQGSDAGGHGHARGASLITLLPEVADALRALALSDEDDEDDDRPVGAIPLIAAGGIVDGRGAAAAMVLGAAGVVMGTRFLAAEEAVVPAQYREELFRASDGGEATARSRVFDEMWGPTFWPQMYDGRSLTNRWYEMEQQGVGIEEIRAELQRDLGRLRETEGAFRDTKSLWAGSGVGLVKKIEKAAEIVEEVREDAKKRLQAGSALF